MAMNLKLNAPGMSVDELESMLPAMGVVLPSGSKLKGGTLSADLAIGGPLANLVISGPVRMSNTKLAGFDTGAKLGALSAFSGKAPSNPDTVIQNASSNVRIAPDGTRADAINLTIPSLAVVTGSGTVSPSGALNFQMMADLQGNRSEARAERAVLGGGDKGGVPFKIEGTTSDPRFVPDVGSMAAGAAKGAIQKSVSEKAGGKSGLGGILGKKPK
jgi:AsmA protein